MDELREWTPRELENVWRGWHAQREIEMQTREMERRDRWEMARYFTAIIISPHLKRPAHPKDIAKFAWDRKPIKKTDIPGLRRELAILKERMEKNGH